MVEAKYYINTDKDKVTCELCPYYCELEDGKTGICRVRSNINGKLYSTNYGLLTAINIDPIEKKPLFHYFPGHQILSIGSNGCNLKCKCCQNWEIAHTTTNNYHNFKKCETKELVEKAKCTNRNIGIAYTYNEPITWFEYMIDIAKEIKKTGLKNVLVSNGYINQAPLHELLEYIDAFNIDLKAFTEEKYQNITLSKLQPVKETILAIVKSGKHIEITNLIIPGINDNHDEFLSMVNWIYNELGEETVLHLSRYFPSYKMSYPATPPKTLKELFEIAKKRLKYVYLGNINIENSQDTYCSKCNNKVISRKGYFTEIIALKNDGKCNCCNNQVIKNI